MNNRKLKWRHLKALNDLYIEGKTNARILDNPFIRNLKKEKRLIRLKPGSETGILANEGYTAYYEQELRLPFQAYHDFLTKSGIDSHGRQNFDEYDLEAFVFIVSNKVEIRKNLSTIRHFSSLIFREKGSKYLEMHPGIVRIVCKLLEIDAFPDRDPKTNTWRCVVDHPNPKSIVLCENLSNLKRPWVASQQQLEFWYVGGNNTARVDQIGEDKLKIPIYYSCDWDLAGLKIYIRLREIFAGKGCYLQLLEPYDKQATLDVGSPDHNSRWQRDVPYSGLDPKAFSQRQLAFIESLITRDQWIEEESQELIELLHHNLIPL